MRENTEETSSQVPSNWLSSRKEQRIPYSWTCKVSNEIRDPHSTLRLKVRDKALILFHTQREFITIWSFLSPVDYGMFFSPRKGLITYFLIVQSDILGFLFCFVFLPILRICSFLFLEFACSCFCCHAQVGSTVPSRKFP